jgi:hypothetical protein
MEPVMPADSNVLNFATQCNLDLPSDNIVVSAITLYQLVRHLTAPITLANDLKTTAMVDSGAMGNFIHLRFVREHNLVTKERTPLTINNVNGHLLSHVDQQVEVQMEVGHHSETLTFDVAPLGGNNIILGLPWLQQHDPQLQWSSGKVTFTSDYCEEHCLDQPASTILNQRPLIRTPIAETPEIESNPISTEEAELFVIEVPKHLVPLKEVIPEEYWDYLDVFDSKKAATTLPEVHGPDIDFMIELDPSKPLPKPSRPYHMNQEE